MEIDIFIDIQIVRDSAYNRLKELARQIRNESVNYNIPYYQRLKTEILRETLVRYITQLNEDIIKQQFLQCFEFYDFEQPIERFQGETDINSTYNRVLAQQIPDESDERQFLQSFEFYDFVQPTERYIFPFQGETDCCLLTELPKLFGNRQLRIAFNRQGEELRVVKKQFTNSQQRVRELEQQVAALQSRLQQEGNA